MPFDIRRALAGPQRWTTLAGVLFLAALAYAAAVHFSAPVYPEDDAFITYRYVDNLVAGRGLVYNPGQRLFGSSTPLYVAVLALAKVAARGAATPELAVRLNFLFYVAAGLGMALALARLVRSRALALVLAAAFVVRDDMLRISTGGMESFLFLGLVLWALWALSSDRWPLAALLAGLSFLARPEGALVALTVFVAWLVASRRRPLPVALGLAGPALAWVVFATAYYGTPVYHSLVAKARPLYPLPFGSGLAYALHELETRVLGSLGPRGLPTAWHLSARTAVLALLAGAGVAGCVRRRAGEPAASRAGAVVAPALFGLMLLFYLVTNPLVFEWYLPPLAGLLFLVSAAGFARLDARLPVFRVAFIAWAAWVALLAPVQRVAAGGSLPDVGVAADPVRVRTAAYRQAAQWLDENLADSAIVLASEVGALGYYYRGPVLDACGLVSPEALPFLPAPANERRTPRDGVIPSAMVRALLPDVIVTMPTFARLSLYNQDAFWQTYAGVAQFPLPMPVWGSTTVDVLVRRDRIAAEPDTTGR